MISGNTDTAVVSVTIPGPQGRKGQDGKDGKDGAPGEKGQDGQDGKDGIVENLTFDNIQGNPSDSESLVEYIEAKVASMLTDLDHYSF